ncbi:MULTISPECIES: hypothetical protein [unclassified Paenibacillus]|uniref:hypothetical protein n=1 Tax=unclassified Paenibacillus TaxID=185978 RepID=UPI0008381EFC|nr:MULTISPECIES: hypothetical protein [unclassified Paenibacillus]NWL87156.1 hypothetical protein [Paenibacillus sp. 79R4]
MSIIYPNIIITLIPLLVFIIIIYYVISIARRMGKRADERLKLDKENAHLLQQQMQEVNLRLTRIEKMLKEVD